MSIRCLMLDEKNRIIDYADLNYPAGEEAQLIPFGEETADAFEAGDIVKFQYEKMFDKVFDGIVVNNEKNMLLLENVRSIGAILQEDLRIEVFVDGVLTFEEENKNENKSENDDGKLNEDKDINEDEDINEDGKDDEIKIYSIDITVKDISSGGMGFYTKENLPMNRIYEYVADWGTTPIITKVKLLRKEKLNEYTFSYGSKFVDLYADEESVLRGGVFAIQARRCQDRRRRDDDII